MNYKSQNNEADLAINYFENRKITLLDVGANDGVTYSNSFDLIRLGNEAYLFEPGSVCQDLLRLYKNNPNVHVFNKGLSDKLEKVVFYESANHIKGGKDKGLVSTTSYDETIRWRKEGVQFIKRDVQVLDWKGWYSHAGRPVLNMISLDTEGSEWTILQQMKLRDMGTEFLIIEWNGDQGLLRKYTDYCNKFGLYEYARNSENLIFSLQPTIL